MQPVSRHRVNEQELTSRSLARSTQVVCQQLLDDVTEEETLEVISEVYDSDVVERINDLEACEHAVRLMLTAKWLSRWRNRLAGQCATIC